MFGVSAAEVGTPTIHKDKIKRIKQIYEEVKNGREPENYSEYNTFELNKQTPLNFLEIKGLNFRRIL
ncbi:MAG: hypothetical protein KAT28_02675 [Candidatus Aenigmarchaeota archaeon]|nr:hypothetical protein [Candidatus Aenigmarchaeota archaeon]